MGVSTGFVFGIGVALGGPKQGLPERVWPCAKCGPHLPKRRGLDLVKESFKGNCRVSSELSDSIELHSLSAGHIDSVALALRRGRAVAAADPAVLLAAAVALDVLLGAVQRADAPDPEVAAPRARVGLAAEVVQPALARRQLWRVLRHVREDGVDCCHLVLAGGGVDHKLRPLADGEDRAK